MVEHGPSQTSQRILAEEASAEPKEDEAERPADDANNITDTSASASVLERQNPEQIVNEKAESWKCKKLRDGPTGSYLMQYEGRSREE